MVKIDKGEQNIEKLTKSAKIGWSDKVFKMDNITNRTKWTKLDKIGQTGENWTNRKNWTKLDKMDRLWHKWPKLTNRQNRTKIGHNEQSKQYLTKLKTWLFAARFVRKNSNEQSWDNLVDF